jgi:RecA-family ATPase
LYSTAELLTLPPPEWLIDNILPEGGLCGLYGAPESTKSFIALDIAMSVATGLPWQGNAVRQGYSLYVAAEGGPGISKRVRAWMQTRGITDIPHMAWLIESISVTSESNDMDLLMERLDNELQETPGLVIIDTLARCLEGNENEQEDMGAFIAGLDKLRHEYGATVLAVHHTRLDGERERGNTAFRGGTDTMISVTRPQNGSVVEVACTKQKDAEHFPSMEFRLELVPDTDSCVLVRTDVENVQKSKHIIDFLANGPMRWDEWLSSTGLAKTTFHRSFSELVKTGQIIKENGLWGLSAPNVELPLELD